MKKILLLFTIGCCMVASLTSKGQGMRVCTPQPIGEKTGGSRYYTQGKSSEWGNSLRYSYELDLGYVAEGQLYNLSKAIQSKASYPNSGNVAYWLGQADVLGYIIPEKSGITDANMYKNRFSAILDTHDRYGNFEQVVQVSTKYGMFYFTIKALIVDGALLQAANHAAEATMPKDK